MEFKSLEITKLKEHLYPTATIQSRLSKYLLVENGLSKPKKRRCGLLSKKAYKKDYVFLILYNIYKKEEIDKGIIFFLFKGLYTLLFLKN